MLEGREIVIGVGGGIAAFKAAALASRLVQSGALVTAVMTASARRFVALTNSASMGASLKVLGNFPGSMITSGPSSFPINCFPILPPLS